MLAVTGLDDRVERLGVTPHGFHDCDRSEISRSCLRRSQHRTAVSTARSRCPGMRQRRPSMESVMDSVVLTFATRMRIVVLRGSCRMVKRSRQCTLGTAISSPRRPRTFVCGRPRRGRSGHRCRRRRTRGERREGVQRRDERDQEREDGGGDERGDGPWVEAVAVVVSPGGVLGVELGTLILVRRSSQ